MVVACRVRRHRGRNAPFAQPQRSRGTRRAAASAAMLASTRTNAKELAKRSKHSGAACAKYRKCSFVFWSPTRTYIRFSLPLSLVVPAGRSSHADLSLQMPCGLPPSYPRAATAVHLETTGSPTVMYSFDSPVPFPDDAFAGDAFGRRRVPPFQDALVVRWDSPLHKFVSKVAPDQDDGFYSTAEETATIRHEYHQKQHPAGGGHSRNRWCRAAAAIRRSTRSSRSSRQNKNSGCSRTVAAAATPRRRHRQQLQQQPTSIF